MEAESKGIKEMLELIAGLKEFAIIGREAFKDGKINLADLALLPILLQKQEALVAAFSGLGEIDDEVKDISAAEAMSVIEALLKAAKEVKEA